MNSGAILARGTPAIEIEDDEDRLFAKAVELGADLLCRAIRTRERGYCAATASKILKGTGVSVSRSHSCGRT